MSSVLSQLEICSLSDRPVDPVVVSGDPGEDVRKSGLGTSGPERGQSGKVPTPVLHVAVQRPAAVTLKAYNGKVKYN